MSYKINNLDLLYTSFDINNIKYLNNIYNIKVSNNKEEVYRLANLNNILMPESIISNEYYYAFNKIKDKSDYVVIKKIKGFGGSGVFKYFNYNDFIINFDMNFINGEKLIFQNYIQSDKNSTIRVILVNKKAVIGAVCLPDNNDFRSNYNLNGTIEKYYMTEEIVKLSENIANIFSLGFVGLDIIKDSVTGKYLLLDVNPYPGINRINKLYEIDLASYIVDSLL